MVLKREPLKCQNVSKVKWIEGGTELVLATKTSKGAQLTNVITRET